MNLRLSKVFLRWLNAEAYGCGLAYTRLLEDERGKSKRI